MALLSQTFASMILLTAALFILAGPVCQVRAACEYTIDQCSNNYGTVRNSTLISPSTSTCIGQSFTASENGNITAVQTTMAQSVAGTSARMNIYKWPSTLLYTSANLAVAGGMATRRFVVSPPLIQTAGTVYIINIVIISGSARMEWFNTNPYSNGSALRICGVSNPPDPSDLAGNDFVFEVVLESFVDSDSDGVRDCEDLCPSNSLLTTPKTLYEDFDRDGYGNFSSNISTCLNTVTGYVADATDCNDRCSQCFPGQTFYQDLDGDGFGSNVTVVTCTIPAGYVRNNKDCNDAAAAINPNATEICDGLDNNCNWQIDENVTTVYYRDFDADGYGNATNSVQACSKPAGYVSISGDCNDTNSSVKPNATEICDFIDNNCNGQIDESVTTIYYRDVDGDGFGSNATLATCSLPAGYVTNNRDCNDTNASVHPNATEVCDGIDNNCNYLVDESTKLPFYRDEDNDGFGNATVVIMACSAPAGYVSNSTDCNDLVAGINPNATEVCDSVDNNCNGQIDENLLITSYPDADGDGYGNGSAPITSCVAPDGYVLDGTDCNDTNSNVRPNAAEVCNDIDDNCNNAIDEFVKVVFYEDLDNDAYGNSSVTTLGCAAPAGFVGVGGDCNDTNPLVQGKTNYRSAARNETSGDYDYVLACSAPAGFVPATGNNENPDNQQSSGISAASVGIGAGIGGTLLVVLLVVLVVWSRRRGEFIGRERLKSVSSGSSSHTWMGASGSLTKRPSGMEMELDADSAALLDVFSGKLQIQRDWIDLKETIGEGEFGKVYVALLTRPNTDDSKGPEKVAVKMLHSDATLKERNDFLREASIMKDFDHVNVIRLMGAVTANPAKLLIVLEFAHLGDLKKYVRASELTEEALKAARPAMDAEALSNTPLSSVPVAQMLSFAADIAAGMEYLASLHFVHRDLAARNCMLAEPTPGKIVCKVADFGMSRDIYESDYYKKAGTDKVPLRWMAPEALSLRKYSEKTDVWSFGVTCFEIFSVGALPYGSVPTSDLLDYLLSGKRLSCPRGCPPAMYSVMSICWQTNPQHRPRFETIAKAMREAVADPECVPASLQKYIILLPLTPADFKGDANDIPLSDVIKGDFSKLGASNEGSGGLVRSQHGGSLESLNNVSPPRDLTAPESPSSNYYQTQDAQFSPVEARARLASVVSKKSSVSEKDHAPAAAHSVAVTIPASISESESESPYVIPQDSRVVLDKGSGSGESAYLNDPNDSV